MYRNFISRFNVSWRMAIYRWYMDSSCIWMVCDFVRIVCIVVVRGWLLQCTATPPSRRRQLMTAIEKHKTFLSSLRWEKPVDLKKLQVYVPNHTQHQFLSIYSRLHVSALISNHHQSFSKADSEKIHAALMCGSPFTLETYNKSIKLFTCILNIEDG